MSEPLTVSGFQELAVGVPDGSEAGTEKKKRRVPSTAYKPGQSGNPGGNKKPRNEKRLSTVQAMRLVMSTEGKKTESVQCAELRATMAEDRQKFLDRLLRLEAEERADRRRREAPGGEAPKPAVEADETVEELVALGVKLLGEVNAKLATAVAGCLAQGGGTGLRPEPGSEGVDVGGG